ncbi:MAG: LiaI-LiaF-like domain-containing protein [Chloroflexota bacterium]
MSTAASSAGDTSRPHRRQRHVIWPLLLILAGLLFLLQNLGILSWTLWGSLAQLWPIILVLLGLELLLRDRVSGAVLMAASAVILAASVAGALFFDSGSPVPAHAPRISQATSQVLDGASRANVHIRYGAGQLTLGPLPNSAAGQLASAAYDGPQQLSPRTRYVVHGHSGLLSYEQGGRGARFPFAGLGGRLGSGQFHLLLNPSIPTTLDVETGASTNSLDLSTLRVSHLTLQTGASQTTITMPDSAGTTTASVTGGAATFNINIPSDVAAQIHYQGGLSTLNVDQSRFPRVGSQSFRSPDYTSAAKRLDLTIRAGVSTVTIH